MRYRWIGKGFAFLAITGHVESFLLKSGFSVKKEKVVDGCEFFGVMRCHDIVKKVYVRVSKVADDLEVEFLGGGQVKEFLKVSGLASLFGMGAIFRRGLKTMDFYERFERDFWDYLEREVETCPERNRTT